MEDLGADDGDDLERRFLEIKNMQHLASERTMQLAHEVGQVRNAMAELQKSMQTLVEIVTPSLIAEERAGLPSHTECHCCTPRSGDMGCYTIKIVS